MYAIKKDLLTSTLPQFYKLSFYEDVCNIPKIIYKAKKVLILILTDTITIEITNPYLKT